MDNELSKADSLRLIADWLDKHPEFNESFWIQCNTWTSKPEEFTAYARALSPVSKRFGDAWAEISRYFGCIRVEININREAVCVKRVIGTRTVPERHYPARTEEIVEWDCGPLLSTVEETDASS